MGVGALDINAAASLTRRWRQSTMAAPWSADRLWSGLVIRWEIRSTRSTPPVAATIGANVAHGLNHGTIGAPGQRPARTGPVGSFELLITPTRNAALNDVERPTLERSKRVSTEGCSLPKRQFLTDYVESLKGPGSRSRRKSWH
jgi:hypothetical protein